MSGLDALAIISVGEEHPARFGRFAFIQINYDRAF